MLRTRQLVTSAGSSSIDSTPSRRKVQPEQIPVHESLPVRERMLPYGCVLCRVCRYFRCDHGRRSVSSAGRCLRCCSEQIDGATQCCQVVGVQCPALATRCQCCREDRCRERFFKLKDNILYIKMIQIIYFLWSFIDGFVESLLEHIKSLMRRIVADSMDVAKVLAKRKVRPKMN